MFCKPIGELRMDKTELSQLKALQLGNNCNMALDTFNVAIVNHDSFMQSKSPKIYSVSKWQQWGKKALVLIHLFNFLGPIYVAGLRVWNDRHVRKAHNGFEEIRGLR